MDDNNGPNENDNGGRNPMGLGEEEIAFRRNQVLMFGVVLLGILAICLAVSMPSDLEFNDAAIPSDGAGDDSAIPSIMMKNLTNSTTKSFFKNPEDSVENKILRNIAIQKAIKGLDNNEWSSGASANAIKQSQESESEVNSKISEGEDSDKERINQIVQSFMATEEFEDFIVDIEITDTIKRLRKEKGYKKRKNTIFDDLFQQIERHFLGDDPKEVHLIRRVGEEMERRAREIIIERKKNRGEDTHEDELIASELYLDYESKFGVADSPLQSDEDEQ